MLYRAFAIIFLTVVCLGQGTSPARADINEALEKATFAALKKVGPSVVQIVTQGGTDLVVVNEKGATFRKVLGPTTGVIVSKDGYIISSAYNFINNPTTILVEIPGDEKKYLAKEIASDKSRMLTLLKIDASNLPVPEIVPKKDLKIGQWSLALGRTLDPDQNNPPSVSMGIISALGRVWGKYIQTDANTSPVNYGGPLIDIRGRVQGLVVPASPRKSGETAGVEWYDSGIGFVVPMEDVMAILPRLKKGVDLKPGLLGVKTKGGNQFAGVPVIAEVLPDSAAARAGLKPGDKIVEVEGKKVGSMAQLKHLLGPKYEGDAIAMKVERDGKEIALAKVELVGKLKAYANSFMGILPLRDDPNLGVGIRYVYPGSPADKAGLKIGDRIVKYGTDKLQGFQGKVRGRDELIEFLNGVKPGAKIRLEVARNEGGKTDSAALTLTEFPGTNLDEKDAPPEKLPAKTSIKKALAPLETPDEQAKVEPPKKEQKDVPTGLIKLTVASRNHQYWVYVHSEYNPNIAQAMLVWLHPPKKNTEKDLEKFVEVWAEHCEERNFLIVIPITESETGWVPTDTSMVQEVIRDAMARYTVDSQRIVAHGIGVGGQMALVLGFSARDLVRGVAVTGAVPTDIEDNQPKQRVSFFIVAGDRDPLAKTIAQRLSDLAKHRIPFIYREIKGMGRQYFNQETLTEVVRWIDALDRM